MKNFNTDVSSNGNRNEGNCLYAVSNGFFFVHHSHYDKMYMDDGCVCERLFQCKIQILCNNKHNNNNNTNGLSKIEDDLQSKSLLNLLKGMPRTEKLVISRLQPSMKSIYSNPSTKYNNKSHIIVSIILERS